MGKIIYRFILLLILVLLVCLLVAGCSSGSRSVATYKLGTEVLEGEGSIEKSPDRGEYKSGTRVTLTAVGKDGWEFYEWAGSIEGNKNPYEAVVNSNMNVGAKFRPDVLPTGVTIDQDYINKSNQDSLSFTFNGAEVGKTCFYSIDDTNNGIDAVSGSEKIEVENQQVSNINVSALDDGVLTLRAYLKDESDNQGDNFTDTVLKDTVEPVPPTVNGISTGSYNTEQSFTVSGEEGARIEYSLDNGSTWNTYEGAVILSAEGTYEVIARQRDEAGNESEYSSVITVTIESSNPASIPDDYIARWRFEGNLYDETGDHNGEAISGTPIYNEVNYREGDTSLNVNGAHLSTIVPLPVLKDNSFSFSAFFLVDSANMTNCQTLVEHDTISAIYYDIDSAKIIGESLYKNIIVEIPSITQDTWHHIVLTYNGSELIFYLDGGIQIYSTTGVDDISFAGEKYMYIGNAKGNYCWQGYIDDIIIYDRALTAGEVSNIYGSY